MTILIQVVNDNPPTLFVGGEGVPEYTAVFSEGQDYLGGPVLVPVALPRVFDPDSGDNSLVSAVVEITEGMLVCTLYAVAYSAIISDLIVSTKNHYFVLPILLVPLHLSVSCNVVLHVTLYL